MKDYVLTKEKWVKEDLFSFQQYLLSFSKGPLKSEWEKRIINTNLPCIAVPSDVVKSVVRKISKGNYLSFIDLWPWDNATTTFVVGGLISQVKDFALQKQYLRTYSAMADNWATIDTIKPKVSDKNICKYVDFASECINDKHIFTRRLGLVLCLKCIDSSTIDQIISIVCTLKQEQEYYVNMACAWLVAECFIKFRDKAIKLFECGYLNKFVNNKAISKCHDSFRVSDSDKLMLKQFVI